LVLPFLMLFACGGSSDDDTQQTALFDGSRASLRDLFTESQLMTAESLGLPLNFGDDPPNIEGTFRIGPVVLLQAATDPNDQFGVGNTDVPFDIVFTEQNTNSLEIDITFPDTELTVFALGVLPQANNLETRRIYSGLLTEFGIENFQETTFLAGGSGEARLFIDPDSLSERVE